MTNNSEEVVDLWDHADNQDFIDLMYRGLGKWARRLSQRTTASDDQIIIERQRSTKRGITLGVYGQSEVPLTLTRYYRGKPRPS